MPATHHFGAALNSRWTEARKDKLRALWGAGKTLGQIARAMKATRGSISGQSRRLHLHFAAMPRPIKPFSDADVNAVSRFHALVQPPNPMGVLKTGDNQRKLGRRVLKGEWKGMPIYSLTLEERATCPRSCKQWLDCYGNNMNRSVRYAQGPELIGALIRDLTELQDAHPGGFVVRLHILGDFYSVDYVKFWRRALKDYPALRVFGYTARQSSDEIGKLIAQTRNAHWDRFAIRTSGGRQGPRTLVLAEDETPAPGVIVCPAQTEATSHCGNCALCWSPAAKHRPIAFRQH